MAQILFDQVRDFTGGLNFRADQFQLKNNESPFIVNLDVDPRGGVFSRAGYKKKHATEVSGNWNPKLLFNYKHPTVPTIILSTGFVTVGSIDGKVYHSTGGDFSVLQESSGPTDLAVKSTNGASATTWQDELYIALGASATNMFKWEAGTTYATSLLASGPTWQPYQTPVGGYMPRAELVRAHANKLFCANTFEDGTAFPNRIRWSHESSPENWFQDDYIDIIAGGEGIRGLAVVDGQLLIFKPKAIYLLMGYDADSFQLVELSTNLGISFPQNVVEGTGGAYFFDYPGGLFFFNRNGIQGIFERLKPTIDTNKINPLKLQFVTLSYINDRLWMSAPFDFTTETTASTSNPTGSAVDYPNVNFIYDPTIGANGAFTMYQSATWYGGAATPTSITGYGLVSGCDWTDSTGAFWFLMINPNTSFKHIMYVDNWEFIDDIPQNTKDDIPEDDDAGDYETIYTTSWFYDDRYVQDKTFVRSLYVVRPVDVSTEIRVDVYHNFNTEAPVTTHDIPLIPIITGGIWGTGLWDTAEFGESDLLEGLRRGGRLKKAKAVQLKFIGPNVNIVGVNGPVGRQWGINSIAWKFKRRKVRSQK